MPHTKIANLYTLSMKQMHLKNCQFDRLSTNIKISVSSGFAESRKYFDFPLLQIYHKFYNIKYFFQIYLSEWNIHPDVKVPSLSTNFIL